jgi:hypothetical protein
MDNNLYLIVAYISQFNPDYKFFIMSPAQKLKWMEGGIHHELGIHKNCLFYFNSKMTSPYKFCTFDAFQEKKAEYIGKPKFNNLT